MSVDFKKDFIEPLNKVLAKPAPSFCEWEYDGEGLWVSACGHEEYFNIYDAVQLTSLFEFCPFKGCGKSIRVMDQGGER